MKQNYDDKNNNDWNSKPLAVAANLLHFKYIKDILNEAKSRKIIKIYFKENFSKETLVIGNFHWNEVVRLLEEKDKFDLINFDRFYSRSFRQ